MLALNLPLNVLWALPHLKLLQETSKYKMPNLHSSPSENDAKSTLWILSQFCWRTELGTFVMYQYKWIGQKSQLALCEITLSLPNSPLTSAFIHSLLCVRHRSRHLEFFTNETEKSLHICKAFGRYPCLPLPLFSSLFCLL